MTLPSLRLKANAERRLRAGHLWVYSNEVDVQATPLNAFAAGDQAILEMANGKPLVGLDRTRTATWQPDGTGYSTLTVIDAAGRAASVKIFVE